MAGAESDASLRLWVVESDISPVEDEVVEADWDVRNDMPANKRQKFSGVIKIISTPFTDEMNVVFRNQTCDSQLKDRRLSFPRPPFLLTSAWFLCKEGATPSLSLLFVMGRIEVI